MGSYDLLSGERGELPERRRHCRVVVLQPVNGGDTHLARGQKKAQ